MKAQMTQPELNMARFAGLLYLIIIVCGITAEVALRGPLIDLSDAGSTASAILGAVDIYRISIAADIIMAIADAGLAILLFILFRPIAPGLALAAMVFRLIQSVMIAMNLMNMQFALLLIAGGQDISGLAPGQAESLAVLFLNIHAHGYDLGLIFFGINSLMTAALIWRSGLVNKWIAPGLGLAGVVYLIGSYLRFFLPESFAVFAPVYGIPVLTETAFCIALLTVGLRRRKAQLA